MPATSSGNEQSSQAGWLSLTFFCEWALIGDTIVASQAEMKKDRWMQGVETYAGY